MEKLGPCIENLKRKFEISFIDTINISIELIKAVERFHSIGMLHLDLKTNNILLEQYNHDDNFYEIETDEAPEI